MAKADTDVIALLRGNVRWWKKAADTTEAVAFALPPRERETQLLLSTAYRERAKLSDKMIKELRDENALAN
ncbi:MAG: hypothetical protein WA734_21820 [Candidatus Acidiferrales bacterium]